jgi:hypothetical protein
VHNIDNVAFKSTRFAHGFFALSLTEISFVDSTVERGGAISFLAFDDAGHRFHRSPTIPLLLAMLRPFKTRSRHTIQTLFYATPHCIVGGVHPRLHQDGNGEFT